MLDFAYCTSYFEATLTASIVFVGDFPFKVNGGLNHLKQIQVNKMQPTKK